MAKWFFVGARSVNIAKEGRRAKMIYVYDQNNELIFKGGKELKEDAAPEQEATPSTNENY